MVIHRLLQRSNYSVSPEFFYNLPKGAKRFMYASLEVDSEEHKKANKNKKSNLKSNIKSR